MMTASRYECPLDGCRWNHEVVAPQLDIPDGPAVGTVYRTTVENTEAVLAAHFRGHSTEDYLRTIVRLRKIEAAAREVIEFEDDGLEPDDSALGRLRAALDGGSW